MFLLWIIEENAPGGGVLACLYRPGGGGFELFLPGGGEFAHQKIVLVLPGGMVRLEIDWYIRSPQKNKQETCEPYVAL